MLTSVVTEVKLEKLNGNRWTLYVHGQDLEYCDYIITGLMREFGIRYPDKRVDKSHMAAWEFFGISDTDLILNCSMAVAERLGVEELLLGHV